MSKLFLFWFTEDEPCQYHGVFDTLEDIERILLNPLPIEDLGSSRWWEGAKVFQLDNETGELVEVEYYHQVPPWWGYTSEEKIGWFRRDKSKVRPLEKGTA